jgi:PKD repeat protein
VTATDPQGKSATDTVEITVTQAGNQAPVVQAAADPVSGDAPLEVRFTAHGSDPDGPGPLIYLWDFDDGGANQFGSTVTHRYMEPGTYTATVTATDGRGAFDTAEVEVTVADPPGNRPPSVQIAADPRSGSAPLTVRFTSAATDPDGDRVSSVWDFGNGDQAGGAGATYTYTVPGTYTASVTVTDPSGASDSDSVQITVAGTAGSGGGGGGGAPPAAAVGTPPVAGGVAGDSDEGGPLVSAPRATRVRQVVRRGLRLRVSCVEACRVSSVLRLSGRRLGASRRGLRIGAGGSRTVVVRLDRTVRRNLLAAMRQAGVKRLTSTVVTRIVTAEGTRTIRAKVTLKL